MNKLSKKQIIAIVCVIVVAVGLIAGILIHRYMSKNGASVNVTGTEKADTEINGTYQITIPSGESDPTIFSMIFDSKNGTYTQSIAVGDKGYDLATGTFEVDGDKITCTPETGDPTSFTITGKCIIADGYFYDGDEIPDGDETFDATCQTESSSGSLTVIAFSKDGTYKQTVDSTETSGTYKRNGYLIDRTGDDGDVMDYVIYDGKISNSYYLKTKEQIEVANDRSDFYIRMPCPEKSGAFSYAFLEKAKQYKETGDVELCKIRKENLVNNGIRTYNRRYEIVSKIGLHNMNRQKKRGIIL